MNEIEKQIFKIAYSNYLSAGDSVSTIPLRNAQEQITYSDTCESLEEDGLIEILDTSDVLHIRYLLTNAGIETAKQVLQES